MKKIALISCANEKKTGFNFIKDIDKESQMFKLSIDYAYKFTDEVYIITTKYGLIKEKEYTPFYNEPLTYVGEIENKLWSLEILSQLNTFTDIHKDEFIVLADRSHYKNYIKFLNNVRIPLNNMSIEEKINYLKKELGELKEEKISYGEKLHILFNSMKKYDYKNFNQIPFNNGIYIVLDKKEDYKDMDRIVRIGTHNDDNKLVIRLKNHYKSGLKDSSFLRKNIGKSILSYNDHEYLYIWSINFNDKINQCKYGDLRNMKIESILEEKISKYMKERFYFVCFEVEGLGERYRLEEGLISTIYNDNEFKCSAKWLGKYSPMAEVRDSNMWVAKGLDKKQLSEKEFREVVDLCVKSNNKSEKNNKEADLG